METKKAILIGIIFLLTGAINFAAEAAKPIAPIRTEVQVSTAQRARMKDLTQVLRMATLTPIVNRNDEVICMELSAIHDKMISDILKAKVGDCFSEVRVVRVFKNGTNSLTKNDTHSVLSISDAMALYQALMGASRVEVDLSRKIGKVKEIVALSYVMD